jgi:hypothetical protein
MALPRKAGHTMASAESKGPGQVIVICGNEASLTGGQVLVREKRKATCQTDATQHPSRRRLSPDGMGGVLNEGTPPFLAELG